jgi:hypothetical protein
MTPTAAQQNNQYNAMEKRLPDKIVEMQKDMQCMLERMEACSRKEE